MMVCRRLHYINKVCLRLLRRYTNEIYPNNSPKIDKNHLKNSAGDGEEKPDAVTCT